MLTVVETPAQAVGRLAVKARKFNVRVAQYPLTGEWYATSHSQPDTLHRVTRWSCDCLGYQRVGRCMHHAALLDLLNELPDPDLTPPAGGRLPSPSTMPVFDAIEAALCMTEMIACDAAFHLEVIVRGPDRGCDEWPSHDEHLASASLTCSVDQFLAWCDWQNERAMVADHAEMAVAA